VVLEPVSELEVTVPLDLQGEVLGDLNARRGRVQRTDTAPNGEGIIVAHAPTSEVQQYAIDLRSLTGGRGRFRATHDHYDVLPSNLADSVRREVAEVA
jgi:elongation factor G